MVRVRDIFDLLCSIAPLELSMDFDNAGFLVGDMDSEVRRVVVALDITTEVIEEASSLGAELIVSHHPVIWDAMKSVTAQDVQQRKIMRLLRSNIAAICMHTNLDIAEGGVNDILMERLGGAVTGVLEVTGENMGCGRVGELERETELFDFLARCKDSLHSNGLRYHDAGRKVKRLAVMGGAGGESVELAAALGCDTYVTADVKYDKFLLAKELSINLIDADHFCTEDPITPILAERINKCFPEIEARVSAVHAQTAKFF